MAFLDLRHAYALADFVRDAQAYAQRIEKTRTPEVLTVDGRAAPVVQDAEDYQELLDRIERVESIESLRQGIRDGEAGLGTTAADARFRLREKHGF